MEDGDLVRLSGELDLASAPALEEVLVQNLAGPVVVVDLSELDFIDSSGYGALVRGKRTLEARGHDFVAQGPLKAEVSTFFDVIIALSSEMYVQSQGSQDQRSAQ